MRRIRRVRSVRYGRRVANAFRQMLSGKYFQTSGSNEARSLRLKTYLDIAVFMLAIMFTVKLSLLC